MAAYTQYHIPLCQAILLFFPSCPDPKPIYKAENKDDGTDSNAQPATDEGHVVQVKIKQAHQDVIKEMTTFFLAQYEITKAVESVVFAHIFTPLPPEVRIEGAGYVLKGRRKPWDYGKTLNLRWGEKGIKPCDDKWIFVFELIPESADEAIRTCEAGNSDP